MGSYWPVPSPDGTRLYFVGGRTLGPKAQVQALEVTSLPPVPIGAAIATADIALVPPVVTPDGDLLLVGGYSGSVTPFRTSTDRNQPLAAQPPISLGDAGKLWTFSITLAPDGRRLYALSAGFSTTLAILDLTTLQPVGGRVALSIDGTSVIWPVAPDGSILVSGRDGLKSSRPTRRSRLPPH